jgi:hypothetical protein
MNLTLLKILVTLESAIAYKAPAITPRDFQVPLRAVAVAALLSGCGDHQLGCSDLHTGDMVTVDGLPATVVDLNRETIAVETVDGTTRYSCEAFAQRGQR